jgi:hypothetical protein
MLPDPDLGHRYILERATCETRAARVEYPD